MTPAETALLPILRLFNSAFQCPASMAWREAYAGAAITWGTARGLGIAHAAQDFLGALLRSRAVPLSIGDEDAKGHPILQDEKAILSLLGALQADDTAAARTEIAKLTEGRVEAAVIRTGLALAQQLDPVKPDCRPQLRPALRVVH